MIANNKKKDMMTGNEQALYALMEELGYSCGLCNTAVQILSQSKHAVSDMLVYLYEERPTEKEFIEMIADYQWLLQC